MMNDMTPIEKLTRDLRSASITLSDTEARFLVDAYYQMQDNRIRADGQCRSMRKDGEPHDVLAWLASQNNTLEDQIRGALKKYAESKPIGRWALSICGIGPVITAGLLAHINIEHCPTAGHLWSFAGMNPTAKWEKGKKRPWNAALKRLCFLIGESFIKVQNRENDYYGAYYAKRKQREIARNEAGEFAEQAAAVLAARRISKDTDAYAAYSSGKLPPAHIHARARRYAVKLFLAHLWETWRTMEGLPVPLPYPIAIKGHAHKIEPPK